jgi:23S rRNA (guanosine2251-2'-O)-methyltransferase
VCRASAGAVEHVPVAVVPNLARFVAEAKGPALWAFAATAEATTAMWDADLGGGGVLTVMPSFPNKRCGVSYMRHGVLISWRS